MSRRTCAAAPTGYDIRLEGHLDEHWSSWFGGVTLLHEDDGTTILRVPVTDQAALHGLLAKVRDLGATLLSVTGTPEPVPEPAPERAPEPAPGPAPEAGQTEVGQAETSRRSRAPGP